MPQFAAQPLITITNDELTVAWVVDNGGGQGGVFVADRASTSASFGTPNQLMPAPLGSTTYVDGQAVADGGNAYFAFDRVALSSDGLTLSASRWAACTWRSSSAPAGPATFVANADGEPVRRLTRALMAGEKLGDPVLGRERRRPRLLQVRPQPVAHGLRVLHQHDGPDLASGIRRKAAALDEDAGRRKHPTSMTADRLTLFVWDEAGEAYGVIRSNATVELQLRDSLRPPLLDPNQRQLLAHLLRRGRRLGLRARPGRRDVTRAARTPEDAK